MAGVYTEQRLNLPNPWEGRRKKCQGFKPDSGNLTVRDYRGASGIVSHGEDGNPSGNRKSRNGNPSPTAERARLWVGMVFSEGTFALIDEATGAAGDVSGFRFPTIL